MFKVLQVNRSTYYKHFKENISPRSVENQELRSDILSIYSKSKKRLGTNKIRQRLIVEYGRKVSVDRVYCLMKSMTLPKMSTVKPNYTYTKSEQSNYHNHLKQKFNPEKPNLVWVSDITYVKVSGNFVYICVIIDLFSRKVISYKTSLNINTQIVIDTFSQAYLKRGCPTCVMFHSDRGTQYTSKECCKLLAKSLLHSLFLLKLTFLTMLLLNLSLYI